MAQTSSPKLILGNWKMNGTPASAVELVRQIKNRLKKTSVVIGVFPPFPLIPSVIEEARSSFIQVGAQDCHAEKAGAHTGDTSASLLKEIGCRFVIVGHSERRANHQETNMIVAAKAKAAIEAGLTAVICVGETLEEREAGKAEAVVTQQVSQSVPTNATPDNVIIAYEPVWAIGTGKVASEKDIAAMHYVIRNSIAKTKLWPENSIAILYGGSVKAVNAGAILNTPGVDGALVGGASLNAEEFCSIALAVL